MTRTQGLIIFRCDFSSKIGFGHVRRCLALADAFTEHGYECVFFCVNFQSSSELFQNREYRIYWLYNEVEELHNESNEICRDVEYSRDRIREIGLENYKHVIAVVDSYDLNSDWLSQVNVDWSTSVFIDDVGGRKLEADFILNTRVGASKLEYSGTCSGDTKFFLGSEYSLIDRSFRENRKESPRPFKHDEKKIKVLVSMGGADPLNICGDLIKNHELFDAGLFDLTFLIPETTPKYIENYRLAQSTPNMNVIGQTNEIHKVYQQYDIAIGAAGVSSLERACIGLPGITVAFVENQLRLARSLEENQVTICTQPTALDISTALKFLVNNPERMENLYKSGLGLVDGLGASRVVNTIIEFLE